MKHSYANLKKFLFPAIVVVAIAALGFGGYFYYVLYQENLDLKERVVGLNEIVSNVKSDMESVKANLESVKNEKDQLVAVLKLEQGENSDLSVALESERGRNKVFDAQIRELSITVGALQKLSETDEELLKKYSKVYFLSENYAPANLSAVGSQYLYNKNKPQLVHSGVAGYLQGMLNAAARDGAELLVVSAYRSFAEQAVVHIGHEITYGSGANQFSADQGYSEHQLGTTVDFTTKEFNGLSLNFENSEAYAWLKKNAYRFGFVVSYPRENMYYHFEPWHWRFVGVNLATKLHNENKYFYELAQRDIDEYLISIFD